MQIQCRYIDIKKAAPVISRSLWVALSSPGLNQVRRVSTDDHHGRDPLEGVGYCLEFEKCPRKSLKTTIHQRDKYLFCMYCIHKLCKLTFT